MPVHFLRLTLRDLRIKGFIYFSGFLYLCCEINTVGEYIRDRRSLNSMMIALTAWTTFYNSEVNIYIKFSIEGDKKADRTVLFYGRVLCTLL